MALPHQSIATISSPQFINLRPLDINPLMSSCEIKVLYVGKNRNRSVISKEVATEMAKTLRGAPIVGYYKQNKEDFVDHGKQIIFDDEGIHFNVLTKPYGFVSPDAKVWFQKFEDTDEFGNSVERQYLMTTGYLWTGQFKECASVIEQGKPQSMELDDQTIQGDWATDFNSNMEFFIINDAIFTKLCILGDNVEPCFEGASVTKPDLSANFSYNLDEKFVNTLFSMIQELRDALKGGNKMDKEVKTAVEFEAAVEPSEPVADSTSKADAETTVTETEFVEQPQTETAAAVTPDQAGEQGIQDPVFEKKKEDEEEKSEESTDKESGSEESEEASKEEDDDKKKKYSLLEQQYTELQSKYTALKAKYDELVAFKQGIEDEKKDALIDEFYMLSEEDKKDVIEHKSDYSLDEIKAKLAVICYEKKVNFNSESSEKIDTKQEQKENDNIITYTYEQNENLPDWVRAVKSVSEEENI